jgi:hypothetical protein
MLRMLVFQRINLSERHAAQETRETGEWIKEPLNKSPEGKLVKR